MHLIALFLFLTVGKPELSILNPGSKGSFDETGLKNPSVVFAVGKWHLFYTARAITSISSGT
jgi:hypothetical protein